MHTARLLCSRVLLLRQSSSALLPRSTFSTSLRSQHKRRVPTLATSLLASTTVRPTRFFSTTSRCDTTGIPMASASDSTTMRAVGLHEYGGVDQLFIDDKTEKPIPAAGEALIRVQATALNRADVLQRKGRYPVPPGASQILGLEFAGEIESFGPGQQESCGFQAGDRVCALLGGGGYAQYVTVPTSMLMRVPESVSLSAAAAFPEAFLTAFQALYAIVLCGACLLCASHQCMCVFLRLFCVLWFCSLSSLSVCLFCCVWLCCVCLTVLCLRWSVLFSSDDSCLYSFLFWYDLSSCLVLSVVLCISISM
jgi:Alcohol dehydrogenase GroES-like domain